MHHERTPTRREKKEPRRLAPGFLGADDEIRTRDPHLGKVMLYQLSHIRMCGNQYSDQTPLAPRGNPMNKGSEGLTLIIHEFIAIRVGAIETAL